MHPPVTPSLVDTLAAFADLPLPESRREAIAPLLDRWLRDANALSAKMSAPAYQGLLPITILSHPAAEGDD